VGVRDNAPRHGRVVAIARSPRRRWELTLASAILSSGLGIAINVATGLKSNWWAWLAVGVLTIAGAIVAYKLTGLESTQQLEPVGDSRHQVDDQTFININSGNVTEVSGDLHYHGSSFWPVFLFAGAAFLVVVALLLVFGIRYT
jgi:hypothetical protein